MTSVDGRARAGPDGAADPPTVRAVPRPDASATPPVDGPSGPVPPPEAVGSPDRGGDPGPADHGPVASGTLRRSRPPRPDGDPRVSSESAPGPGGSQPVRRPVPPTFPSPGQPPPGVARREGRHARPDQRGEQFHTPPTGYRPRHAAPDAPTERFGAVAPTMAPPASATSAATRDAEDTGAPVSDDLADRVRIVLAERRSPTRAVRTVAEIEAQTETGELLLGNLLRAQLTLAVRLGLVALLLLGSLPVLFLVLPGLGSAAVLGIRIPWLLVGLAPYPLLIGLGWLFIRAAERNELDFADNVED